jgi:FtsH-binding integral membrane protein
MEKYLVANKSTKNYYLGFSYISWFLPLFALMVIYIISNNYTHELTPQLYIANTYLYILLAIIIVAASWKILDDSPVNATRIFSSGWNLVGLTVLTFVSLFCTLLSSPENVAIKHTSWFIFVLTMGIMSYLNYAKGNINGNIGHIFVGLIVLVGTLTWFAYTKPLNYVDSGGDSLLLFHDNSEVFFSRFRIYSWVALGLFSCLLLYDTNRVRKHAVEKVIECRGKHLGCVDYPVESLDIFLDIANLFTNMSNVLR